MEMAGVILGSVRDTDVVARYGGDEFVVVLPETGVEMGLRVAERVRERIEHHAFTGGRACACVSRPPSASPPSPPTRSRRSSS
jgi:diguanylate cyclase (GGDEF)-like protein